jgi:GNAT superfamily N-acetyltransferase
VTDVLERFVIDYVLIGEEDTDNLTAATWTDADERKRKRDSHGRFAKKVESPLSVSGPRRSKKLKEVLAADTGDSDDLDPELAADLRSAFTGKFHNLRTEVSEVRPGKQVGTVKVAGSVFDDTGDEVGLFTRLIRRRKNGELEAEHVSLQLDQDVQGQGFAHAFNRELFDWYRENEIKRVVLLADIDVGGYAWARAGYDWKPDDVDGLLEIQYRIHEARLTDSEILNRVPPERREEQRLLARELFRDLDGTVTEDTDPDDELPDIIEMWPTPYELSQLGRWPGAGRDDWWIGKSIMMDSNWWGVLYLDDVDA